MNMAALTDIPEHYRLILCDIWGCLHNGVSSFPAARSRLRTWRDEGRHICLLTNGPRPATSIAKQLSNLGISAEYYDDIASSGAVGIEYIRSEYSGMNFHFMGSKKDRQDLIDAGISIDQGKAPAALICTGLDEDAQNDIERSIETLTCFRQLDLPFLCLNPDKVVIRGDKTEYCAGAVGNAFEKMGGKTVYFGKPGSEIYDFAISNASQKMGYSPCKSQILAIGDGVATDMLGALRAGIDFAFISSGIEQEQIDKLGVREFFLQISKEFGLEGYAPRFMSTCIA